MNVLILSRKKMDGIGGLSRLFIELSFHLKAKTYPIYPGNILHIFRLPLKEMDLIYLCDSTLLFFGVFFKFFLKKPLVLNAHGLDLTYSNPLYQIILKRFIKRVDLIILDSNPSLKLLNKFKIPPRKIKIVNPGISVAHLNSSSIINLPLKEKKIFLTTVGNLVPRKGHQWFIEKVLKKLPENYIYLIVGDGSEKKSIQESIKKLNFKYRVFLLKHLDHKELSYVLKNTDIYVSPNLKVKNNFESFGIAAGEAAALGLPVVASDVDGISDLIKNNKNGLLVNPNSKAFVKALRSLENQSSRYKLGQKAKKFTHEKFNWGKTSEEYLQALRAISL